MSELPRFFASVALLSLALGCNALFDIEQGTPLEAADDSSTTGNGGNGGSGGDGGSNGGDGGSNGGDGGSNGSNGAASGSNGNGGSAGSSGGIDSSSTGVTSTSNTSGGPDTTTGNTASGGSGGSTSTQTSTTGSIDTTLPEPVSCSCSGTTPDDASLVDDFEDGDGLTLMRGGRDGSYYSYSGAAVATAELECDSDAADGCVALCLEGVLDGGDYPYAGLGLTLVNMSDGPLPYDMSDFAGISFRVKGSIPADAPLRIEFATLETQAEQFGGSCTGDGCFDHYKYILPAPASTASFERHEVRFASLGQGNGGGAWVEHWSDSTKAAWKPSEVVNINWQVASSPESLSSVPFDFCIDDIRLLEPDTAPPIATWDFEADVLDVGRVDANVTVSQASSTSALGDYSLRADIEAGGWGCGTLSGSSVECWQFDATECAANSADCAPVNKGVFALNDDNEPIDIQPGDKISLWFQLPEGDLQWVNVYLAAGEDYLWTVFPISFPAMRDNWYYAEFDVPEGIPSPVHEWGIEVGAAEDFTGSVYVDEMSIQRP